MGAKIKYTTEEYINLVKEKHKNRYSYPNTIYKGYSKKIEVYCEIHGAFQIEARGCPHCGWQSHWRRSDYIKKANNRVCTFYTIRCFNEEEEFYKIGITMNTTKSRYYGKVNLPYEYEVISEVKGSAGFIWDLERDEKRKLKLLHYTPKLSFGGSETECFTNYKIECN